MGLVNFQPKNSDVHIYTSSGHVMLYHGGGSIVVKTEKVLTPAMVLKKVSSFLLSMAIYVAKL